MNPTVSWNVKSPSSGNKTDHHVVLQELKLWIKFTSQIIHELQLPVGDVMLFVFHFSQISFRKSLFFSSILLNILNLQVNQNLPACRATPPNRPASSCLSVSFKQLLMTSRSQCDKWWPFAWWGLIQSRSKYIFSFQRRKNEFCASHTFFIWFFFTFS